MSPQKHGLSSNFDVDYTIVYRSREDKAKASNGFQSLVQTLASVGLAVEVRNGENCALLVFVKVASDKRLNEVVYRSRYAWLKLLLEASY